VASEDSGGLGRPPRLPGPGIARKLIPVLAIFGLTAAVALLSGAAFGIAPALEASAVHLQPALKEGGSAGAGREGGRLRRAFVAAVEDECEVASLARRHECGLVAEPGNARQLENEVKRLVASVRTRVITEAHLALKVEQQQGPAPSERGVDGLIKATQLGLGDRGRTEPRRQRRYDFRHRFGGADHVALDQGFEGRLPAARDLPDE